MLHRNILVDPASPAEKSLTMPIIGVAGHSGSGKTTLIERLVTELGRRGLRLGVVKHAHKGFSMDRPGKDTDRFFVAGADPVLVSGPSESALRFRDPVALEDADPWLCRLFSPADLVLVEGFKGAPWPRIWVGPDAPPFEALFQVAPGGRFQRDDVAAIADALVSHAEAWHTARPVVAGVLIGGGSRRMGQPKHLLERGGRIWLEHILDAVRPLVSQSVLLGDGALPAGVSDLARLPDAPDAEGPMAGLLSMFRCFPRAAVLLVSCDAPDLGTTDLAPLVGQRRLGADAVAWQVGGRPQQLPVLVEPTAFSRVEGRGRAGGRTASLHGLLDDLRVIGLPWDPADLARLRGYNTPGEAGDSQ